MFLKTCFKCGKKCETLSEDNLCDDCLKGDSLIEKLKLPNFKVCNYTKKIFYQNKYFEEDEILKMLPQIMRKNIVLSNNSKIENINIFDFEIKSNTMFFKLKLDIK